ncbi:MAG: hypothetical protein UT86_C0005G0026 [Candidatus Magasanikbacteria bacterium GW2011_GWC2_40_17]|uniref:DUF5673 domain-containing protein n=1 Tax=Candidatus Magasanikbacteria bacterium GW2011_GWA2_42_32 TaxID=1619039 RepID=A0A0G1A6V2_9BACT|nr:MAG: hypothetical protein UT86_C0005G0026 [Candidatus Magasanikbacteria bacterium GW2011_GWC2_40_17]KKS56762.1 MAG: hypothetical protein UV20_C0006G0045 [Candidatus Magasanikbacteria bacterium GW2011_GWA2_42_32]
MEENQMSVFDNWGNVLHTWQIPEYHQPERGRTWYIVASIIFVALLGYSIFAQNFLFAFLILLFAAIIFMHSTREPLYLNIGVSDKGVILNKRLIVYSGLSAFWIINEPPLTKNLYLKFNGGFQPPLSIHLAEEDAEEVRATLGQFLKEDKRQIEEPLSDLLWKVLKL